MKKIPWTQNLLTEAERVEQLARWKREAEAVAYLARADVQDRILRELAA